MSFQVKAENKQLSCKRQTIWCSSSFLLLQEPCSIQVAFNPNSQKQMCPYENLHKLTPFKFYLSIQFILVMHAQIKMTSKIGLCSILPPLPPQLSLTRNDHTENFSNLIWYSPSYYQIPCLHYTFLLFQFYIVSTENEAMLTTHPPTHLSPQPSTFRS